MVSLLSPFHLPFPLIPHDPAIGPAECRRTIFANLEHKIKHLTSDNNHFDWIFNQLAVKSLHKLIYIEPLNGYVENTD